MFINLLMIGGVAFRIKHHSVRIFYGWQASALGRLVEKFDQNHALLIIW